MRKWIYTFAGAAAMTGFWSIGSYPWGMPTWLAVLSAGLFFPALSWSNWLAAERTNSRFVWAVFGWSVAAAWANLGVLLWR